MPGNREEGFLRNTSFLPKNNLPMEVGVMKLTISVSLLYRCYIPNLVKIGPVVLEKKMLTHDAHRTLHEEGRQPKIYFIFNYVQVD